VFQEAIEQCAENFGPIPRRISLWDRLTYWRVARPDWLKQNPNDKLETLFLNLGMLRREGIVVWGHIIQANNLLFSPGPFDCPGEVVYSLDGTNPVDPDELGSIASALFSLKHTKPSDPDLASVANYLTNQMIRVLGKPVPRAISPGLACRISTVYVVRKHLPAPAHSLERSLLPIIVHPKPPHIALVLPSRYWPRALVKWWQHTAPGAAPARTNGN
jgi:hypothetical protein